MSVLYQLPGTFQRLIKKKDKLTPCLNNLVGQVGPSLIKRGMELLHFVSIASQKNFIALYHMGIYANPKLLDWFVAEYPKHCKLKLDMGKSCVRLKKMDDIPYELIGELMQKMSAEDWIKCMKKI